MVLMKFVSSIFSWTGFDPLLDLLKVPRPANDFDAGKGADRLTQVEVPISILVVLVTVL
jgi:hypothetical protein